MDIRTVFDDRVRLLWQEFIMAEKLSALQERQCADFLALLIEWSEKINLTTLTAPSAAIKYHFQDSLVVDRTLDMHTINTLCDVGSGAGFPGIPLAIKYPHLRVVLIEVNNKKIDFLDLVIEKLDLENVEIYPHDWRTFLRTTDDTVDLFCSRASLHTDELLRVFKPGCTYKDAQLVYWAAVEWQPVDREKPFVRQEVPYSVGSKKRKLVFMSRPNIG
jgi:16S rRNA (guanine(527)-N(7))-methyltransferase RsmG